MLHGHLQPAHAIGRSLRKRFGIVPMVVRDAVARDHGPGAIGPPPAMYEYRTGGGIVQERQELRNLLVGRSGITAQRNRNVLHPGRLHRLFLLVRAAAAAPEVDDGLHAQARQAFEALFAGLGAAVDVLVYLMEIGHARGLLGAEEGTKNEERNKK